MISTLLSREGRAAQRVSVALLSAATIAVGACDTDQAVAPKPTAPVAEAPTVAQPMITVPNTGSIVLKLVDANAQVVHAMGAQFQLFGSGGFKMTIIDGAPGDAEPTIGVVLLKGLPLGFYTVCETIPPGIDYGVSAPGCKTTDVYAGATSGLNYLTLSAFHVFWQIVDYVPNNVGDAIFTLTDSTNKVIAWFKDNQSPDVDPGNGFFNVQVPYDGTWSICRVAPPPGYVLTPVNKTCTSFQAVQGTTTTIVKTYVYPIASAMWRVTDGTKDINDQPVLIGPSTFTATGGPNNTVTTIVDNGPNDLDKKLGKIAAMLPGIGSYSICETVPPVGHWNANPACKIVTVASGVAGQGGYFVNHEAQVPNF